MAFYLQGLLPLVLINLITDLFETVIIVSHLTVVSVQLIQGFPIAQQSRKIPNFLFQFINHIILFLQRFFKYFAFNFVLFHLLLSQQYKPFRKTFLISLYLLFQFVHLALKIVFGFLDGLHLPFSLVHIIVFFNNHLFQKLYPFLRLLILLFKELVLLDVLRN
jgi:hypothetical protein